MTAQKPNCNVAIKPISMVDSFQNLYFFHSPLCQAVPYHPQILDGCYLKGRCIPHGVYIYRPGKIPRVVYILPYVEDSRILIPTTISSCSSFFHPGSHSGIPLFPDCFGFSGMLFKWNDVAAWLFFSLALNERHLRWVSWHKFSLAQKQMLLSSSSCCHLYERVTLEKMC